MAEHTYHQYCPVAHALDLVGDRWTLLIVRNLLIGPKRFVDLQTGLPGLGTNILTVRLKGLEQDGLIVRRFLPPPAASTVYELTNYGRQLEEALTALAHWGAQSLGTPAPDQVIKPDAVMLALYGFFKPVGEMQMGQATYQIDCEDAQFSDVFRVHIDGGRVEVKPGVVSDPDVIIHLNVETLYALSARQISLRDAIAQSTVSLEGKPNAVAQFRQHYEILP